MNLKADIIAEGRKAAKERRPRFFNPYGQFDYLYSSLKRDLWDKGYDTELKLQHKGKPPMQEKVTIRMRIKNNKICKDPNIVLKDILDEVHWLERVLEIPYHVAVPLAHSLHTPHSTDLDLYLTYRQLGRLIAYRQTEGLNCYFSFPWVQSVEDPFPEPAKPQSFAPIDLRKFNCE